MQLLHIIDIIRFWAEYTYKPIIGACLSRLQAIKAGRIPVPLGDTLWKSQIALDESNTPWFFHRRIPYERSPARPSTPSNSGQLQIPLGERPFCRPSSDRPSLGNDASPASRQSSRQRHYRDTTPLRERYVIPEIDSYNWILDRDPGHGDLLLLRIDANGKRRRPLILFDSAHWDDPDFMSILADEKQRHHSDVPRTFRVDKKGRNYLWHCSRSKFPFIRRQTQFCAILPLDRTLYDRQRQRQCQNPKSKESQLFEPLESVLNVPVLLADVDHLFTKWCFCGCPWNEHSPPMIQCSNAKCNLGWYHNRCVGLADDDSRDFWLCDTCHNIPNEERTDISTEDLMEYDEIVEASSYRVQRTRTFIRAWNKHIWPSEDSVLREFKNITRNLDVVKSAAHTIHRNGVHTDAELPRYWVLSKTEPRKLIMASSRERQLVYHQKVADENCEGNSGDADEDDIDSDEGAVDGIEDALDSMTLGQARAGRASNLFRSPSPQPRPRGNNRYPSPHHH